MPQQSDLESLFREARLNLALQAMKSDATMSQRRAAALYNVPQSTISDQRAGIPSQRDTYPNASKLLKHEEEALIEYIRILDAQGFALTFNYVRDMANQLHVAHHGGVVGINCVTD